MSKPKMSQHKVIQMVSQLSGLSQKACKTVIEDYITVLKQCCLEGMEVTIPTLGALGVRYKPYRDPVMKPNVTAGGKLMPTNPREEHNVPSFRMSKAFTEDCKKLTWKNPVYKPQSAMMQEEEDGDDDE